MSPTSKTPKAIVAFRKDNTVDNLPPHLQSIDYLVPQIVKDMGQLIGLKSDARVAHWNEETFKTELIDAYQELASNTSILLNLCSVTDLSEDAVYSVSHRLAKNVDPLVSLHARVDHLFRAYQQQEPNVLTADAQKLWAALEFRSEEITGLSFEALLAQA